MLTDFRIQGERIYTQDAIMVFSAVWKLLLITSAAILLGLLELPDWSLLTYGLLGFGFAAIGVTMFLWPTILLIRAVGFQFSVFGFVWIGSVGIARNLANSGMEMSDARWYAASTMTLLFGIVFVLFYFIEIRRAIANRVASRVMD